MNAHDGSRSRLRLGLLASMFVASGPLGFLLAANPPKAAADGLLPTVTIPTLPVTVPTVSLPSLTTTSGTTTTTTTTTSTTTAGTTTAAATPAASGAASADGAAASAPATATPAVASLAERTVAGAVHLAGGSISIPVRSVTPPNGLSLVVTVAPRVVAAKAALKASVRVRDARGYLVRGATVTIRSIPNGLLTTVARKQSADDGRAAFVVRPKANGLRATKRLWLLVTATDPARLKTVSVSRSVALPIAAGIR